MTSSRYLQIHGEAVRLALKAAASEATGFGDHDAAFVWEDAAAAFKKVRYKPEDMLTEAEIDAVQQQLLARLEPPLHLPERSL